MSHRRTLLAASIIAGLCCFTGSVLAQDATQQPAKPKTAQEKADAAKAQQLEGITVTGIRASLEKSLDTKRNADAVVEAVTAEDIGKFPNTNVAEAMTQIPGVAIDRLFGQGDRVSIDGTDPSLNLTFLNGQPISQTPWQYGAQPNRGFDFTMLAPEVVGRLEVYKSPEARLPEGSLGGTILLHTLNPLDLPANTVRTSFGLNYNDQASPGTRPSGSALYSWKNDSNTFGIVGSIQHYEEKIDRQGIEIFTYSPISKYAGSPGVAAGLANGSLSPNLIVPDEVNSAWFQQKRKRDTATLGIQIHPTSNWDIDLNSLFVRENFNNFNQSLYPFFGATPNNFTSVTTNNGVVTGGHACGNDSPTCAGPAASLLDSQVRHSVVRTSAFDLKSTYRGDGWSIGGAAGYSKAVNNDISQAFMEPQYSGGYTWDINKGFAFDSPDAARNPANWHMGDTPNGGGWAGNYGQYSARSRDTYAQLDFSKDFDSFFNQLLVGYRFNRHEEGMQAHVYGGNAPISLAGLGTDGYSDTLGGFSGILSGASNHLIPDQNALYNWVRSTNGGNEDPGTYLNGTYNVVEKTNAAYAQLNFAGGDFHGNVGVRYAHTVTDGSSFEPGLTSLPPPPGSFVTNSNTSKNWLPSVNVAYDAAEDVVLRFAAAKVIARVPYNLQVASNLFLNDTPLTGSGGNANLSPYKSTNFSLSGEWYFAPQSYFAVTGFYKKLADYVTLATAPEIHFNSGSINTPDIFAAQLASGLCTADGYCTYQVTRPANTGSGKVRGGSLSYQQAFGDTGFGVTANYTYAKASLDSGGGLPYNSKNSYTVSPFYEKGPFSARVTYNWRSAYLAGGYIAGAALGTTKAYGELGATLGYKLNEITSFSLSGMNLTNEQYVQYIGSPDQPSGKYTTGRRYMAAVHFAM
ncbi:TonB-dependent receptor [Luteibacter sp. Sphag1AF]|uniref:TonB-dependent receptor n=1 Tax=Luteibacter sp. Sphag1AF TaxID=2587031 RepID=UPI001621AD4D|nr:TonB-dependent receptor [Luteibacter sp. Sphag1AF]MBB3226724.1 TonB-dependent receptor [Luteibacter sp. Sphag1AF]